MARWEDEDALHRVGNHTPEDGYDAGHNERVQVAMGGPALARG